MQLPAADLWQLRLELEGLSAATAGISGSHIRERTERLPAEGQWTFDDYARLPDDGMRYEVTQGELYLSPVPRPLHQLIIFLIPNVLGNFLKVRKLGTAFGAPVDVILPGKLGDPVQPDLLFIHSERLHVIGETYIEGAPGLVMEVLSPSNPAHDRRLKNELYAEAGVTEYWIVDPHERTVEIFVHQDGTYGLFGRFGEGGTARSKVLDGFAVDLDEIIQA